MKFISWNVNGLRAVAGKGFADIFTELDADFVCLQETKLQAGQLDLETINTVEGATYNYPYNGKAAAVGKTVSEVAQDLGWSSSVWDFSKDFPTLK